MSIFGMREGSWSVWSEKDPRWNMEGRGYVGIFSMPEAAKLAIEQRQKELGQEPPDDLKYSYMKD